MDAAVCERCVASCVARACPKPREAPVTIANARDMMNVYDTYLRHNHSGQKATLLTEILGVRRKKCTRTPRDTEQGFGCWSSHANNGINQTINSRFIDTCRGTRI